MDIFNFVVATCLWIHSFWGSWHLHISHLNRFCLSLPSIPFLLPLSLITLPVSKCSPALKRKTHMVGHAVIPKQNLLCRCAIPHMNIFKTHNKGMMQTIQTSVSHLLNCLTSLPKNTMKNVQWSSPFYRWGNWNELFITCLESDRQQQNNTVKS